MQGLLVAREAYQSSYPGVAIGCFRCRLKWIADRIGRVATGGGMSNENADSEPPIPERGGDSLQAPARITTTRLERALDWASGLAPSPIVFATSCCAMSLSQADDFMEAFGTGPPAISSRSADLLILAGSLTRRQVPLVREVYARMLEPRWVIAWGACAISGGAYDNYSTLSGFSRVVPVDLIVHGCPPKPESLRDALSLLRSGVVREPTSRSSESRDWPIQRLGRIE